MKGCVFAYSVRGCETARRICGCFAEAPFRRFAPKRLAQQDFEPLPQPKGDFYGQHFASEDVLVFVGACGIAVREIAPYVRDKQTDPAVLVADERGTFVIALLSGHIGGANALAQDLAEALGATPVITTATDVNGRFSVDAWAARCGFAIGDMKLAKAVSAAILEGEVPLQCDLPLAGPLPAGVVAGDRGALGIYVGARTTLPFAQTLQILPPVLHLGIGCRKGVSAAAIAAAVDTVLASAGLDRRAVAQVCSIDLKADEPGLLAFCADNGWPLHCFTAAQLAAVKGEFTASAFVRSITGVDNVCERAALLGADRLLVHKTAINAVTVAVAAENLEVCFV